MKILVLGSNGMAGHMLVQYFHEKGYDVTAFAREKGHYAQQIVGDAMDSNELKQVLCENAYDIVINAIGVLNQAVDRNLANGIYINSVLPHFLAEVLEETRTRLFHISTDCVFSGKRGNYEETSSPDENSYYGRSKALGEIRDEKNLTIRTSIIGPELKSSGVGLYHWFMQQHGCVHGFVNVLWSGVTTLELAKAMDAAIQQNLTGLYHLSNNQKISKFELLRLLNKHMRNNEISIMPDDFAVSDKSLKNTRTDFQYQIPDYEFMIEELAVWIREHRNLYTQYNIKG